MTFINIPDAINPNQTWEAPVLTFADLPLVGNNLGDVRITQDTAFVYVWNGTSWVPRGTTGSGTVVGPVSSVFGEIAIYADTSGQNVTRSTGTGVAHLTSGVLSVSPVVLTSEVSGILPIANGGTNNSSLAAGAAYSTGTQLTTETNLSVSRGGTGVGTFTANGILFGNGTSPVQVTAAGSANQILRVPGGGNPPSFGSIDLSSSAAVGSSILSPANGGSGLSAVGSANQFLRVNNAGTANVYVDLLGTANQVIATNNAGNTTLSLPQDIATTSNPSFAALNTIGTGGNGYLSVVNQSSAPSTPASGFRLYTDASNRFSWKGTNGFVRTFDGTANTADRVYTLPNISGSFILDQGQQSINGGKTFVPVVLTDAANIATDASLGNTFRVTLGGNRNLSAPTNPVDGQKAVWVFIQDGVGGRTLTFDAVFNFGVFPTLVLSSPAGKRDFMGAIYNSANSQWNVVAYSVGF